MKTYTVNEAKDLILANAESGVESCFNESLHFGVGGSIYTYTEDALASNIMLSQYEDIHSAFCTIREDQLVDFLKWLENKYGYLYLN